MATFENETQEATPAAPKPNFTRNRTRQEQYSRPPARKPNRYAGDCDRCHQRVEAEQGWLTGSPGAWGVEHRGDCLSAVKAEAPEFVETRTSTDLALHEGRYTIEFADGSYKTLRVRRQDDDANFKPGVLIVSFLSGSDNDSDYTGFGHVEADGTIRIWRKFLQSTELREAVKVLRGSPDGAREAYAIRSGRCSRCGRTLTVPASLHAGMGPECARKA